MPAARPLFRYISLQCSAKDDTSPIVTLRLFRISVLCSLITFLFLSNVTAYAEWVAVKQDYRFSGFQTVYVDPDTTRREGNFVAIWQLIDFKWMQGSARGPARFSSTKTHKQFDCQEKRVRLLAYTEFSLQMGAGIQVNGHVDKDRWLPVGPDSINYALWQLACGKE